MNPNPENSPLASETNPSDTSLLSRRSAIKRVALLVGASLSPALLDGIARAQSAGGLAARPVNLSPAQFALVDAIAERILPRTDTPGARDVLVPQFIDVMFGGYMTAADKKTWSDGLADIEARSQRAHRRGFAQLPEAQQDVILKAVAVESQGKERTFFQQIRDLTLIGYFSSEPVGRNVTQYDPIPGRFDACLPLSEVGNRSYTR
jgi:gluconate 2-dehydrogenase gamma chain